MFKSRHRRGCVECIRDFPSIEIGRGKLIRCLLDVDGRLLTRDGAEVPKPNLSANIDLRRCIPQREMNT